MKASENIAYINIKFRSEVHFIILFIDNLGIHLSGFFNYPPEQDLLGIQLSGILNYPHRI